jgi:hypothetical protein
LTLLPDNNPAFAGIPKKVMTQFMSKFHELITAAGLAGQKIDIEDIESAFTDTKPETVKKHLRAYLDIHLEAVQHVTGIFPSASTIIKLAEIDLGPISGATLAAANEHCKNTVDGIAKPRHARFLMEKLSRFIEGNTVNVPKDELVSILYDEYVTFIREADNGLVSIAGTLNEAIFIRSLLNAGLAEGNDMVKTGQKSDGDLKIQHHGKKGVEILYVEIKSYAARERLLRGLQDIQSQNKIGIGFFNNPSEFNPKRTETLLAAGPLAIYMPRATWEKVSEDSKTKLTRMGDLVYRPLDMFVDDMKGFVENGRLPVFNRLP